MEQLLFVITGLVSLYSRGTVKETPITSGRGSRGHLVVLVSQSHKKLRLSLMQEVQEELHNNMKKTKRLALYSLFGTSWPLSLFSLISLLQSCAFCVNNPKLTTRVAVAKYEGTLSMTSS